MRKTERRHRYQNCAVGMLVLASAVLMGCQSTAVESAETTERATMTQSATTTPSIETTQSAAADGFTITFDYPQNMWEGMNLTNAAFHSQAEFETAAVGFMKTIEETLGEYKWYERYASHTTGLKITTKITDTSYAGIGGDMSYPSTDGADGLMTTVRLDKRMVQAGANVYPHELTHVMCGNSFSFSLNEGAADYCNRKCTGASVQTGPAANVNDWLIGFYEAEAKQSMSEADFAAYLQDKTEIMNQMGAAGTAYPYGNSGTKGLLWYTYSESFFTYLADTYGMDAVMKLYHNGTGDESYRMLDAKGYEGILQDWKNMLAQYEPKADFNAMMQYQQKLAAGMKEQS